MLVPAPVLEPMPPDWVLDKWRMRCTTYCIVACANLSSPSVWMRGKDVVTILEVLSLLCGQPLGSRVPPGCEAYDCLFDIRDVVVRVPSLQTSHGGGCEPCALVGFRPVLVPKRGSVAKVVAVSFGVSSRDVRQPLNFDATRTFTIVLGLRRTR